MKTLAVLLLTNTSAVAAGNVQSDILKEALENEVKARRAKAVTLVGNIANQAKATLDSHVETLKSYRRQANDMAAIVKKMDRAVRFFLETGNPLPYYKAAGRERDAVNFCIGVGIPTPAGFYDDKSADWNVPADWTPTDTAEVPAADA